MDEIKHVFARRLVKREGKDISLQFVSRESITVWPPYTSARNRPIEKIDAFQMQCLRQTLKVNTTYAQMITDQVKTHTSDYLFNEANKIEKERRHNKKGVAFHRVSSF